MNKLAFLTAYLHKSNEEDAINKTAAPKFMKLFRKGKLSHFDIGEITKRLNLKPRTIRFLGGGAEGANHLVTHPKTGLASMKTYNPNSLFYHPDYVQSKTRALKRLNPDLVAPFVGVHPTRPAVYSEYVGGSAPVGKWSGTAKMSSKPGKPGWLSSSLWEPPPAPVIAKLPKDMASKGLRYNITDLHADNVINNKIVDFLLVNKIYQKTTAGRFSAIADKIKKKVMTGKMDPTKAEMIIHKMQKGFSDLMAKGKNTHVTKKNLNEVMASVPNNFKWHGV